MQSPLDLINIESNTAPATGFLNNFRFMRAVQTIFVRKEKLYSASVRKNNPEVDETIKLIDTRVQKT